MKILILAPFCTLPDEPGFNRFLYLARLLSKKHDVTLVTSSFNHSEKKQRLTPKHEENLEIHLIPEPGYTGNVSLRRLWSHKIFVSNFIDWFLKSSIEKNYQIVYSAYPFISTNIFLGGLKEKLNFKLVVDVQDIWPESISAVIPLFLKLPKFLMPFSYSADRAYRSADLLIAVSETYLARAKNANKNAKGLVAYIGSDFDTIEKSSPQSLDAKKYHFLYMGTLSYSYDIETLLLAFKQLLYCRSDFHLHIAGGGPGEKKLLSLMGKNVTFYGYLNYPELCSLAKGVNFFINPIKKSASASITNKICDYISFKKPVINCQQSPEVQELLKKIGGSNYVAGDVDSLIRALETQVNDFIFKQNELDDNFYDLFDRRKSYRIIENFITEKK